LGLRLEPVKDSGEVVPDSTVRKEFYMRKSVLRAGEELGRVTILFSLDEVENGKWGFLKTRKIRLEDPPFFFSGKLSLGLCATSLGTFLGEQAAEPVSQAEGEEAVGCVSSAPEF
jgi:hypothetical protein